MTNLDTNNTPFLHWPQLDNEPKPYAWPPAPPVYQPVPIPPMPTPKVKHTKGWAIGWALAFAVMTIVATFWLLAYIGTRYSPQCGQATPSDTTYTVCVTPSNGQIAVNGEVSP